MNIIKRLSKMLGLAMIIAIVAGLMNLAFVAPAQAATTADFTSTWSAGASADAKATAVSYAGANAKGKILLQEVRATMSALEQGKFAVPTKADIDQYGTVVHSTAEANAALAKEIPVYDALVNHARAKIAKLKLKLKHASTHKQKRVLKKKLKRAKRQLKRIYADVHWKFRPMLVLPRGVCFRNTGANDHLNLTSFVECVGGSDAAVVLGFDPAVRDMRVIAKVKTDGSVVAGCLNFAFFDIPPGTPDQSLFIIVKTFVGVQLQVAVSVHVVGDLTVYGVMMQDGKPCDSKTQVKHVDEYVAVTPITVSETDTDKALAFGQSSVQAQASVRVQVQQSVQASVQIDVSLAMHLECASTMSLSLDRPNDVDQSVTHPGEPTDWSFTKDTAHATSPEGAGNVTFTISANIGTVKFVTANSPCETVGLRDNVVKTITKPSGTYDFDICYIASTENPSTYSGTDTITLSAVFAGQTYTVTQTITVNPTPIIPL